MNDSLLSLAIERIEDINSVVLENLASLLPRQYSKKQISFLELHRKKYVGIAGWLRHFYGLPNALSVQQLLCDEWLRYKPFAHSVWQDSIIIQEIHLRTPYLQDMFEDFSAAWFLCETSAVRRYFKELFEIESAYSAFMPSNLRNLADPSEPATKREAFTMTKDAIDAAAVRIQEGEGRLAGAGITDPRALFKMIPAEFERNPHLFADFFLDHARSYFLDIPGQQLALLDPIFDRMHWQPYLKAIKRFSRQISTSESFSVYTNISGAGVLQATKRGRPRGFGPSLRV